MANDRNPEPIPPEILAAYKRAMGDVEAFRQIMAARKLRGRIVLTFDVAPDKPLQFLCAVEKAQSARLTAESE